MTPPVSLHSQETGLVARKTLLVKCPVTCLPLNLEETYGQKKTVNPVTHCPQVMHSYIFWLTVARDKSFA